MKAQHTPEKSYIASRLWNPLTKLTFYVSELPEKCGGGDWGYTKKRFQALPLSEYWKRRFNADCSRCNDIAQFQEV